MDFVAKLKQAAQKIDQEADPEFQLKRAAKIQEKREAYRRRLQERMGDLFDIHARQLVDGKDPRECKDKPILLNLSETEADMWKKRLRTRMVDEEKRIVQYYEKVRQDGKNAGVLDNEYSGQSILKINEEEPRVELIPTPRYDDIDWKG